MSGKEYLKQIRKIDAKLKNKAYDKKQLEEIGADTSVVRFEISTLRRQREEILKNIEQMNEADYDVLHMIYVQGKTLQEIASERKISYSLATTIHGRALKRLEKLISTA